MVGKVVCVIRQQNIWGKVLVFKYGGYPTGLSLTQQTHEDLYMQQGTTSQSLKHMRHNL